MTVKTAFLFVAGLVFLAGGSFAGFYSFAFLGLSMILLGAFFSLKVEDDEYD